MSLSCCPMAFSTELRASCSADEKLPVVSALLRFMRRALKIELLVPMMKPTLSKPVMQSLDLGEPSENFVPTYFSRAKPYSVGLVG